jgi:hypothetical protein
MKQIKKYWIIPAIIIPVGLITILRITGSSGFRYDAKRWANASFSGANLVNAEGISNLKRPLLLIRLDNAAVVPDQKDLVSLNIPADSVADPKYMKLLRKHKGDILLASTDDALAARIWMVLSQTGVTNIYIYPSDRDNELFKQEFRPDTISEPEF